MSDTETWTQRRGREYTEANASRDRGSRLARRLLHERLRLEDAERPIDKRIAAARFEAACEVLAAQFGYTGTAFHLAVLTPLREAMEAGRPALNHSGGGNLAYLAWEADLVESIDGELRKLGAL